MGYPILVNTDFAGFYRIAQDTNTIPDINAFILKQEPNYLADLLGLTLANLLIANLSGSPQAPTDSRFLAIWNALEITVESGAGFNQFGYFWFSDLDKKVLRSEGIKDMLKGFLFFDIVREQRFKNTNSGTTVPLMEVSSAATAIEGNSVMISRYNSAVKSYAAIYEYIRQNAGDYPEYNGIKISAIIA